MLMIRTAHIDGGSVALRVRRGLAAETCLGLATMRTIFGLALAAALVPLSATAASAAFTDTSNSDTGLLDPLHGYCSNGCADNGNNSPVTGTGNPVNFGFTVSPGPNSGDFLLEVLVPTNKDSSPTSLSFGLTGTDSNGSVSATASLVSSSKWTSGDLDSFLGINASPNNPIGAFAGSTDTGDTSSTGFYAYQADLGNTNLQSPSNPGVSPLLNITQPLPTGAYVVAFLNEGTTGNPDWVATANSGAILVPKGGKAPEPGSLMLLSTCLLGFGLARRFRRRARSVASSA